MNNCNAEQWESRLILVNNLHFGETGNFEASHSYNMISPSGDSVQFRTQLEACEPLVGTAIPTGMFNFLGILYQYKKTACYCDSFQCIQGGATLFTPVVPTGACCLPTGTCAIRSQATCEAQGGTYLGDGTTCTPNPCPPNDACADAHSVTHMPFTVNLDNTYATDDNPPISCGPGGMTLTKHGLWFRYDGAGYQVTASTCNTYGTLEDTKITVYSGTCTDLACVGGNDNDIMCIVGGRSYRSTFSWCALPGTTYYILVGSAGPTYGTFRLELTEGSACTGACCMPNGTCIEVTSATCELAGGIFHGVGTTCTPSPCAPLNDLCANAQTITSFPANFLIDNTSATDDGTGQNCGNGAPTHGLWYEVVGNDYQLTVSTCNTVGNLNDTKIQVYVGWCVLDTACVGGNDNDSDCSTNPLRSQFTWCAKSGITYHILVGSNAMKNTACQFTRR